MNESSSARGFPTDSGTLLLLRAACLINEDTGHTHLQEFLSMGAEPTSVEDITGEVFGNKSGLPVYFVDYEPGTEPFSEQSVIVTLVDEILRLRGEA